MRTRKTRTPERQKEIDAHVPTDEFMTSNIRRACRAGFEVSTQRLVSIANGEAEDATPFASVRAAALLAQVSLGKQPQNLFLESNAWFDTVCQIALKHFKNPDDYNAWATEVIAILEQMQ